MAFNSWAASTSYSVGNVVRASTLQDTGLVFKCTVAGTSDSTEPVWPKVLGGSTIDNTTLKWLAVTAVGEELQKLAPSAIIELYEIKLTPALNDVASETTLRYHPGTNELSSRITFNGFAYDAVPVEITGYDTTTKGVLPRPTMSIANANNAVSNLLVSGGASGGAMNPLKAEVKRIRTCVKFLDAVNFTGGSNPTADPYAKFDDDIYYIDRLASENPFTVSFELVSKLDMTKVILPGRRFLEYCPWEYKDPNTCGWEPSGKYWDVNDKGVENYSEDVCGKRYSSCKKRFETRDAYKDRYPFGGFPGVRMGH
jgi:lambda family phage minor tail protein L